MERKNHAVFLLLLSSMSFALALVGCNHPSTTLINQALAATNATFFGVNIREEIPLSPSQLETLKHIVDQFPKHYESLPGDLTTGDGYFKLNGVEFEWLGDALRVEKNGHDGYFAVRSSALDQMYMAFTNLYNPAGTTPRPSREEWLKILRTLDKPNSTQ